MRRLLWITLLAMMLSLPMAAADPGGDPNDHASPEAQGSAAADGSAAAPADSSTSISDPPGNPCRPYCLSE